MPLLVALKWKSKVSLRPTIGAQTGPSLQAARQWSSMLCGENFRAPGLYPHPASPLASFCLSLNKLRDCSQVSLFQSI